MGHSVPRQLWGFLKSKKLALILISLLTIVAICQVLVLARLWDPSAPQPGRVTGKIYGSWWFIGLAGLLLVNLLACTAHNFYYRLKTGSRNWASWGSTIFHAGLSVIIIGTLVTGQTRVICSILLVKGEPKSIPYQALLTEAATGFNPNDRFTITMKDQITEANTAGMDPQTFSEVELKGDTTTTVKTKITESQQLTYREIYLYPNTYGYALHLKVTDNHGNIAAEQTVPLESGENSAGVKGYRRNDVVLQPWGDRFALAYYPDALNPSIQITAEKDGAAKPQITISPGEGLEFKGYRITVDEIRPWTKFFTVYDPGAKVVFAGVVLSLVGQMMLVLFGRVKRLNQPAEKR